MQNSDPNITSKANKGLVENKGKNIVDRSDPILKRDPVSTGASPRPNGTGQIQIQSIIRQHY